MMHSKMTDTRNMNILTSHLFMFSQPDVDGYRNKCEFSIGRHPITSGMILLTDDSCHININMYLTGGKLDWYLDFANALMVNSLNFNLTL